jgi:hypothetical protein
MFLFKFKSGDTYWDIGDVRAIRKTYLLLRSAAHHQHHDDGEELSPAAATHQPALDSADLRVLKQLEILAGKSSWTIEETLRKLLISFPPQKPSMPPTSSILVDGKLTKSKKSGPHYQAHLYHPRQQYPSQPPSNDVWPRQGTMPPPATTNGAPSSMGHSDNGSMACMFPTAPPPPPILKRGRSRSFDGIASASHAPPVRPSAADHATETHRMPLTLPMPLKRKRSNSMPMMRRCPSRFELNQSTETSNAEEPILLPILSSSECDNMTASEMVARFFS